MAKTAMVTGASGGIGKACAEAMAKAGYAVTLVARNEQKLEEVRASLPGTGHTILRADLSTVDDIALVAAHLSEHHPDVLVNNAGVGVYGGFANQPLEPQLAMMRLNMDALVTLSHVFLRGARSGDALINVASTLGYLGFPYASAYAGTKAFVLTFSESLWHEYASTGVYVTALCPGVTATEFHHASGGTDANRPPANIAQTPEQVAAVLMTTLERRSRPSVISGFTNWMMVFSFRFLPRAFMVNTMGGFAPKDPPRLAPAGVAR